MNTNMIALRTAILSDTPVCLWGPPGIGKTALLQALAKDMGARLETLIGSTLDPTDIARPVVGTDGQVELVCAPAFRRVAEALARGEQAILFFDEMGSTPQSVQAAFLRVVHERVVGDVSLRGCRIVAAANPLDQAAGGWDLAPAAANRWLHLDWSVDVEEWCAGEIAGWGQARTPEHAAASSLIASWIRNRPNVLIDCPTQLEKAQRGWPSPRSWSALAGVLAMIDAPTAKAAALTEAGHVLAHGLVGVAATEFLHWVADQNLPRPEDVISGKEKLPTDRADRQRAAMESVISYAIHRKVDPARVWEVLQTCRKDVQVSLGTLYYRAAEKAGIDVTGVKGFEALAADINMANSKVGGGRVRYRRTMK